MVQARVGFPPCETALNASVCAYTLDEPDLLTIPDLTADPRTRDNRSGHGGAVHPLLCRYTLARARRASARQPLRDRP